MFCLYVSGNIQPFLSWLAANITDPLNIVMGKILIDIFIQLIMGQLNPISCKNAKNNARPSDIFK